MTFTNVDVEGTKTDVVYLICIIGYLVLLAGIAIWKSRDVKDQSDFAVAGRTLSPWMMVCTMLAVWIGTGSIVGNAEQTYESGMAAMLLPLGTLAGMALLSLIAARARTVEATTVPEIIERRFGATARNLSMLSLVIAYMVIVSYQFNAGGAVLEVIVGDKEPTPVGVDHSLTRKQLTDGSLHYEYNPEWAGTARFIVRSNTKRRSAETHSIDLLHVLNSSSEDGVVGPSSAANQQQRVERFQFQRDSLKGTQFIVTEIPDRGTVTVVSPILTARFATMIAAAFIITYAAVAGLMSLAWMDLVTGSLIMLTMVIAFPIYWIKAGGWEGIEAAFVADGRAAHTNLWGVYSPTQLINYILPVFLLVLGDANQYQRIFASRSAKGARTAVISMVFIAFTVELLIIACAWIASSMTPDPEQGKYILIYAARHFLALPLGCLFMVTVVAIIISTADSFLHVPATCVVNDLYCPYINRNATQKQLLWVSRLLVVVFGLVAYVVTFLFSESTGFFDKALYAFTIYGACITPTLVAALVWKRATKEGAIASICSGAIVTLAWNESEFVQARIPEALAGLDAVLPAITLSVTMLVAVSFLTPSDVVAKTAKKT
ncbi:MAG: sodium:solute symporter family protein [Pirellulaceae bacterium]